MRAGLSCQLRNNRFRDLTKQTLREEQRARERAARVGASVAKRLCPRSDNNEAGHQHLQDTIAVKLDAAGGVYLVAGNEKVYWGVFVNYGTVYVAPVPFYTKGREAMKKQLPKEYKRIRLR